MATTRTGFRALLAATAILISVSANAAQVQAAEHRTIVPRGSNGFGQLDVQAGVNGAVTPGVPLWVTNIGGAVDSSPTVDKGIVYVGSDDGYLYALDAATGAQIWRVQTGGPIVSSPAVSGGVVFVGSANQQVWALSAK